MSVEMKVQRARASFWWVTMRIGRLESRTCVVFGRTRSVVGKFYGVGCKLFIGLVNREM
jgi:hypothetical protein